MDVLSFAPAARFPAIAHYGDHSEMLQPGKAFATRTILEDGQIRTTQLYVDEWFSPPEGFPSLDDALLGAAELTGGMESSMAVFEYDGRFQVGRLQWQLHDLNGKQLSPRQHINMEGAPPEEFTGFFGGSDPVDKFELFQRSFSDARPVPIRAIVDGMTQLGFDPPAPKVYDSPSLLDAVKAAGPPVD